MPEDKKDNEPKHKHHRTETEAIDWSTVYKCETEQCWLPFGCYWNYPLPAAE